MNPGIFREYDIRGVVGKDLTEPVVENIGKAYGSFLQEKSGNKVVVGSDNRLSSPSLKKALISGLVSTGCEVTDVGTVPTPVLYFSIHHYKTSGGVMVTGSHNPLEFNGLKMCVGLGSIYGKDIQGLRGRIERKNFLEGGGSVSQAQPIPDYVNMLKTKVKIGRSLKVVTDTGNGTGGLVLPGLLRELGCEVTDLFSELDGRFPNHLPDPTVPEFLDALIKKVAEEKADVGIGLDGDADRIGAIDENGNIVWGDKLLALYSRQVLKDGPQKIIFDVKCSQGLSEDIKSHGGIPVMWKTGHSLIKEKMKEEGSPLAGEMSGHMFFGGDYLGYDDGIFASLKLVELLSNTEKSLGGLAEEIPHYFATPEIRVDCPDEKKFDVIARVKAYFKKDFDTIDIDGVRVLFGDGWGLARASNTQPVIVLRFEAKTEERLTEIKEMVTKKVREEMGQL